MRNLITILFICLLPFIGEDTTYAQFRKLDE